MKFRFEADLDFQLQAVEAVCNLFRGQEICRTEFTVMQDRAEPQARMAFAATDLGFGNRLTLLDDEILANLKDIQLRNGLPPSKSLETGDFTVEMETGTGKTYVYLRTIFELNKRYGFTNSSSSCRRWPSKRASTNPSRSLTTISGRSIPERPSSISSTTRRNSAKSEISPRVRKSRSWS